MPSLPQRNPIGAHTNSGAITTATPIPRPLGQESVPTHLELTAKGGTVSVIADQNNTTPTTALGMSLSVSDGTRLLSVPNGLTVRVIAASGVTVDYQWVQYS
jgi:hypothetical protein